MSTYVARARTNVFTVLDLDLFKQAMKPFDVQVHTNPEGKAYVVAYDGWPNTRWNEDENDWDEVDVSDIIAAHLPPGEVCIITEVGNEAMRYLSGWAVAVNAAGDKVEVDLASITDLARSLV